MDFSLVMNDINGGIDFAPVWDAMSPNCLDDGGIWDLLPQLVGEDDPDIHTLVPPPFQGEDDDVEEEEEKEKKEKEKDVDVEVDHKRKRMASRQQSSSMSSLMVKLPSGKEVCVPESVLQAQLREFKTYVSSVIVTEADRKKLMKERRLLQGRASSGKSREKHKMETQGLAKAVEEQNARMQGLLAALKEQVCIHFEHLVDPHQLLLFNEDLDRQLSHYICAQGAKSWQ